VTVGIVGLGLVGMALAERLLEAGEAVMGLDPDPARETLLSSLGGQGAASLAQMAGTCKAVVVAVYSTEQVEAVLFGPDGLAEGTERLTCICVTTCTPERASAIGRRLAEGGHALIEFPISGTSAQIRRGEATGLVAGDVEARAEHAALLATLCPERLEFGPAGDAARAKLGINLVLQLNRAALAEGLAFAEALGLEPVGFLTALRRSAAASAVMAGKGPKMATRDFRPESRIAQTLKDADMILETARSAGQKLPLMASQRELLRDAIARVGGDLDSSAVIEAIRPGLSA
jgi:3-hydroxyisobutyrate dehydrogenase-like beta-hydroxyacid dehydrogenase